VSDLDLSQIDMTDPKAMEYVRAWAQREQEKRQAAEAQLGELQSKQHAAEVQSMLRELKAPESIASLYPADAKADKESVKTFLKEKIGFDSDVNDNWVRYEQRERGEPVPPPEDEMVKLEKQYVKETTDFFRDKRFLAPSPAEEKSMEEAKRKVFDELLPKWDREIAEGRRGPIVDPQGYGGLIDPPSWAIHTQYATRSR